MLTAKAEDIPFDLKHYPHIVHNGQAKDLKRELKKRINGSIDNPENSLSKVDLNLEFSINSISLINKPKITLTTGRDYISPSRVSFKLDIHNPSLKKIEYESFEIAIILPKGVSIDFRYSKLFSLPAKLQDEMKLYNIQTSEYIFPNGWRTFIIPLLTENSEVYKKPVDIILRLFTELGYLDFPFYR